MAVQGKKGLNKSEGMDKGPLLFHAMSRECCLEVSEPHKRLGSTHDH
jgi:hypothetical protein